MGLRGFFSVFMITLFLSGTLSAAPVISSITPSNGSVVGGNNITILGSGFTGASAVDFGNRPAVIFNIDSDTSITATAPPGTAGTVDVTVTALSQTSAISRADLYTYTQSSWSGIVSGINNDAVTLFDTATDTITSVIPLPTDSLAAVITPDGTTIYAVDLTLASIEVIDVATNTIVGTIPMTAGSGSFDIIVSPDGMRLYVSNNTSGFVSVIDIPTQSVVTDIFVAPNLGSLSITPDGSTVYVVNFSFGDITPIDTATFAVGPGIPTGVIPGMISITPDGTTAYVGNSFSDTISVIDLTTNVVVNTIVFPPGSGPYGSSILPNGTTLYVANINNSTVTVVDIATDTIVQTINLLPGSRPFWVVSTPDGKKVYVINESTDDVTPIDVATNTAGTPFGNFMGDVQDIVMSPDQAPVAAFTAVLNPVGTPSLFDASSSISPIGTIASYEWDFGDGTIVTTASPTINHSYLSEGPFNVVLTVTNSAGTSTAKVFSSRFMSNNGSPLATLTQTVSISPAPPTNPSGFQKFCRYPFQTDIINVISWTAPASGPPPSAYRIYRNAELTDLIATIPGNGLLQYEDHNRRKNVVYTYYIVAVSGTGALSPPISISIHPKR